MKTLLIDAIVGIGFPVEQLGLQCQEAGLADFNPVTASWKWQRERLVGLQQTMLEELYEGLRHARDNLTVEPPAPAPLITRIITGV